jgi:hypothetical protein
MDANTNSPAPPPPFPQKKNPEMGRRDELLCTKATCQENILGPKYIVFKLMMSFLVGGLSG